MDYAKPLTMYAIFIMYSRMLAYTFYILYNVSHIMYIHFNYVANIITIIHLIFAYNSKNTINWRNVIMRKLTKSQVIARVKRNNTLVVYLLPSKCSPLNTTWATLIQPYEIPLIMGQNGIVYSVQHGIDYEFNDLINSYRYYNCNSELGNRVHYYIEEKES